MNLLSRYFLAIFYVSPITSGAAGLASRPDIQKVLQFVQQSEQANLALQIQIAEIPASPFEESRRGKFIEQHFKRAGLSQCGRDALGNVLGWIKGETDRTLVIAAHLDTVFPPETNFSVRILSATRYLGPGVADDSRGLAALLLMAEALRFGAIRPKMSLLFVADVGEEGVGNLRGIHYLFEEGQYGGKLDAFISIDGADDTRIVAAEIGSRRYRLTITGPGGHSWENFGRVNPAHALGRVITRLADLEVSEKPKTTYNVGRIGGGTSINSIPFSSWLEFDMRSEDEATLIGLEKRFLALVKEGVGEENDSRKESGTSLQYDTRLLGLRHAVNNPPNEALIKAVRDARKELGLPDSSLISGSTDSNVADSLGKPAITLGGGGASGNHHSLQEWYDPENAPRGVQALILAAMLYMEAR